MGKKISDLVTNPDVEVDYSGEAYVHAMQEGRDTWGRFSRVFGISYNPATRQLTGAGGWAVTLPFARSAKPELAETGSPGLVSAADQAKLDGRPEPLATDQDANALVTRGASYARDASSGTPINLPSSIYGVLRVFGRAANRLVQYYDEVGSSGTGWLWRRTQNDDGWTAWRRFIMSDDGASIRDALAALPEDNRLDAAALKNLRTTVVSLLTGMDAAARGQFMADMARDMIPPGGVWMTSEDGTGLVGLGLSVEDVASQQDILIGTDTEKVVTAAAIGGLIIPREIAYAATLDVDFAGETPVWSFENLISCTGALTLRANLFPEWMEGKEFTVRVIRASGSGAITLADKSGGASVEYRDNLSASDLPPLGTDAGDWVEVRGKITGETVWCVMAFASGQA